MFFAPGFHSVAEGLRCGVGGRDDVFERRDAGPDVEFGDAGESERRRLCEGERRVHPVQHFSVPVVGGKRGRCPERETAVPEVIEGHEVFAPYEAELEVELPGPGYLPVQLEDGFLGRAESRTPLRRSRDSIQPRKRRAVLISIQAELVAFLTS